jgi:hypothetical protein
LRFSIPQRLAFFLKQTSQRVVQSARERKKRSLQRKNKIMMELETAAGAGASGGVDTTAAATRFTVTYNKQPVGVAFDSLDAATVGDLKRRLAELTGVPVENQKLMLKGAPPPLSPWARAPHGLSSSPVWCGVWSMQACSWTTR